MRFLIAAGLAMLGFFAALPAGAALIAGPSISVTVDGARVDFTPTIVSCDGSVRTCDGSVRTCDGSVRTCDGSVFVGRGAFEGTGFTFETDTVFKQDPFINFGIGLANTKDEAITFTVTFTTPILGGPYNHVTSTLGGTMTDGRGNGVSATDLSMSVTLDAATISGVTIGSDCAEGAGAPGTTYECPSGGNGFGPGSADVPEQSYTLLSTTLTVTLSAHDQAAFEGRAEVTAVAEVTEPGSLLVIGSALLGLAGLARRRTARQAPR